MCVCVFIYNVLEKVSVRFHFRCYGYINILYYITIILQLACVVSCIIGRGKKALLYLYIISMLDYERLHRKCSHHPTYH